MSAVAYCEFPDVLLSVSEHHRAVAAEDGHVLRVACGKAELYAFLWAFCFSTRSSRISPENHQKFIGISPELTGVHQRFTRMLPELRQNFAGISNRSTLYKKRGQTTTQPLPAASPVTSFRLQVEVVTPPARWMASFSTSFVPLVWLPFVYRCVFFRLC